MRNDQKVLKHALEEILITEELSRRAATRLDGSSQSASADFSSTLLQSLVKRAVALCQAGTAGISLLESTPDGAEIFRWAVVAGTLEQYVGSTAPCDFSPCGVCLARRSPQLFSYPVSCY